MNGPAAGAQLRTRTSSPDEQVDTRRRRPSGGDRPAEAAASCEPQPNSAGWAPSPRNPSTDQVATNSPEACGVRLTWLSCSEMWIVRMPRSRNKPRPGVGGVGRQGLPAKRPGEVEAGRLDQLRDQAGIGALTEHRRRPAGADASTQSQGPFSEGLVGALDRREPGIGVAAGPRLDAGVEVERAAEDAKRSSSRLATSTERLSRKSPGPTGCPARRDECRA